MTLKELLLKYEFDTVVPDLLTIDEPIKDNLYAFKEAFDTLRRMAPGDADGEQIVVSLEVETEENGTEIERYLYASNCGGYLWKSSLAKEVVIEADITEIRALAQILWHITFFGFTPERDGYRRYEIENEYERKASLLRYHQFCNYAASSASRIPPIGNSVVYCRRWMNGAPITLVKRVEIGLSGCVMPAKNDRLPSTNALEESKVL